jgi:hypothetical protein
VNLTTAQSYELLLRHGVYAAEACDKCGRILGAVQFTRTSETGVWCSQACRGDLRKEAIRKGGRPRKYRTERARQSAERFQNAERQRTFRAKQLMQLPGVLA